MNKEWHSLKNLRVTETPEISAEATIKPDSSWFDGHFPGFPILPGIAQLGIVSDLIRMAAANKGKTISISQIWKVRFRQFIRPNDTVSVVTSPDKHDPNTYRFKLLVKGQIACNGVMATGAADDEITTKEHG
ncbi:MAG: hypothetical protein A2W19_14910 [Spirochaetes bacterium RBG_16_49_21]|nr:MAG: hypothetical protein A2W19_14910 [Spirochaetes bacterium RBG_16_49_21]